MHRITKIETVGVRAHDREMDLGPLTLLRGPVGAGKTSMADAIRIAALGCVPSIGRDSTAIARLMRGGRMNVRLSLDDGRTCERGYVRRGERITGEASASWMPPKSRLTDVAESIRSLMGRDDREAAEHLDLRQLLSCSPAERAKRIEELLDATGIPVGEQIRRAATLAVLRLAGVDLARIPDDLESAEGAAKGAMMLLTGPVQAVLPGVHRMVERELESGGIPKTLDLAKGKKLDAAEAMRRRIAARAELEDRVNSLRAPAEALTEISARREAEVSRRAAAERDVREAERVAGIRAELDPLVPALKQRIAEEEERLAAAVSRIPEADAARAEADGLTEPPPIDAPAVVQQDAEQISAAEALLADARALPEPEAVAIDPADLIRVECLRADAERLWDEVDEVVVPEPLYTTVFEATRDQAARELARMQTSPWREVEHVADGLAEWGASLPTILPKRNAIGLAVTRLRELATENGGRLAETELALDRARQALTKAEKDRTVRDRQIRDARERITSLRESAEEADQLASKVTEDANAAADRASATARAQWLAQVRALQDRAATLRKDAVAAAKQENDALRKAYAEAVGDREVQVAEISDRRKALLARAESIRTAAVESQSALDRARADLRAAEERLAGIASVTLDTATARTTIEQATAAIAEHDQALKTLRAADSLRAEMKALITQIDAATAERDCWTAAEWALQRIREMDLAARAAGLEARMRRYLRVAGRTEDPYLRASRGTCDFGMRRGRQEISVEALSGGETALFVACLAGAVISLRGPEIRILLLEAADLGDRPEAQQTLLACREMVASGDIDQVIAATCIDIEAPDGWTTVDLEPLEVEAVQS